MAVSPASKLPVELWIKIALTLRDGFPCPQLHSNLNGHPCAAGDCPSTYFNAARPLSESCRFLRAAVQPILYQHIKVRPTYALTHHIPSLASTLSARPDLRSSVRTLKLDEVKEGIRCSAFLEVLPLLVGVRFLSLEGVVIEEPIVQLLRNASHLHTLHIYISRWGMEVPEKWSEDASFGGNLTELHVHNMGDDLPYQTPRNLQLFVPTVKKLSIDAKLLAELTQLPAFLSFGPSLLQLVTEADDPIYHPSIHQLLSRSPNIRDLEADGLSLISPIDEEYLPNLRSIKASSSLVAALLRGRPIRSITTRTDPRLFVRKLPDVETLLLTGLSDQRGGLEVIDALWAACPGLIRLELQPAGGSDFGLLARRIETLFPSNAAALPRLQILHLKHSFTESYREIAMEIPLSEEMQSERERIVEAKRRYCQDLYDVWLRPKYAWTYIRDDDAWTPQTRSFV